MRKSVFTINGSAAENSTNRKLIEYLVGLAGDELSVDVFDDLKTLPHFDPRCATDNPPAGVVDFRERVQRADGILICTPEYVFSIPSGLKNAIEWCVSTTVFTNKPVGLITASADGEHGHAELHLILKTLQAQLSPETSLLIRGVKGKLNKQGEITDGKTERDLRAFLQAFRRSVGM